MYEAVSVALRAFYGDTDWTRALQRDGMRAALLAALPVLLGEPVASVVVMDWFPGLGPYPLRTDYTEAGRKLPTGTKLYVIDEVA